MRNIFSIFLNNFKRFFLSGLLLWLPLIATFLIIKFIVDLLNVSFSSLPETIRPDTIIGFHVPGLGFIFSIFILLLSGFLVSNFFGKKLVLLGEGLLNRIPLIRSIYKATKQISSAVFSKKNSSFRKVVMIEYPRKGCFSLGFQTADPVSLVDNTALITVFLPTTPNPTSGFLLLLPVNEVTPIDIPIEEALKFIISLGVVSPGMLHKTIPDTDT